MGSLPSPVAHKEHEVFLPFVQRCDTDCGVMGFLGASINNVHFQYRKLKDLLDSVKNLQEGVNYERN